MSTVVLYTVIKEPIAFFEEEHLPSHSFDLLFALTFVELGCRLLDKFRLALICSDGTKVWILLSLRSGNCSLHLRNLAHQPLHLFLRLRFSGLFALRQQHIWIEIAAHVFGGLHHRNVHQCRNQPVSIAVRTFTRFPAVETGECWVLERRGISETRADRTHSPQPTPSVPARGGAGGPRAWNEPCAHPLLRHRACMSHTPASVRARGPRVFLKFQIFLVAFS